MSVISLREWVWLATDVFNLCAGCLHTQSSREYTLQPRKQQDKFVAVVFLAYTILI